ncbi:glycosyltransferase [Tateyamaria sp. SN6-1]|uniref:glycosyltransferase n=1 Tax=Tateyamaria sp. SN6-1 TaxID=3092148 RepID=UPI0039F5A2F4
MGRDLKYNHRFRIDVLRTKGRFARLDQYLETLSVKGFDVAGIPFRVVDDLLSADADVDFAALAPLARHTVGGQPRLLAAVLEDLGRGAAHRLHEIVSDEAAHPMTRFEAMGWANFVAHGSRFPGHGTKARDIFQFWDQAQPPPEVQEGKALWQRVADRHVWYSDETARAFIADAFGQRAAAAYADLWHPALKSDVFRLYRLLHCGGVYCDADSRPEHRAAEFVTVAGDRVWASSMTNVPNCATINGFIAAPPQSPVIEGLLEQVLRNISDTASRGVFWLSGPGAFTTHLYAAKGQYDIGLLPQGLLKSSVFRQFDAAYKHTEQNWRVFEHNKGLGNEAGLARALQHVGAARG